MSKTELRVSVQLTERLADEFNAMAKGGDFRVVALPETTKLADALDAIVEAVAPQDATLLGSVRTVQELANKFRAIQGNDSQVVNSPDTAKYGQAIKAVIKNIPSV